MRQYEIKAIDITPDLGSLFPTLNRNNAPPADLRMNLLRDRLIEAAGRVGVWMASEQDLIGPRTDPLTGRFSKTLVTRDVVSAPLFAWKLQDGHQGSLLRAGVQIGAIAASLAMNSGIDNMVIVPLVGDWGTIDSRRWVLHGLVLGERT